MISTQSETNPRTLKIQKLNDQLRTQSKGGQILLTRSVSQMNLNEQYELHVKIAQFNHFTEDNDPYGEHDYGSLQLDGQTYFFKIDYYDTDYRFLSPDPSNEDLTKRVLTIGHISDL